MRKPCLFAADPAQPDASPAQISDLMRVKGFVEIAGRWIHPVREIAAWDTITDGYVIQTDSGITSGTCWKLG